MSGARLERGADGRLRLHGPLDFGTAAALWQEGLAAVAGEGVTEVDLSAVERTDSAGVALLLDWARRAQGAGGRLRLHGVPEQLTAIIRASGVEGVVEIADEPH